MTLPRPCKSRPLVGSFFHLVWVRASGLVLLACMAGGALAQAVALQEGGLAEAGMQSAPVCAWHAAELRQTACTAEEARPPVDPPQEEHSNAEPPVQWALALDSRRYSDPLPLRQLGQSDWARHARARPGGNWVQVEQSLQLSRQARGSGQRWSLVARQFGRVVLDEATARRLVQIETGATDRADWQWRPELHYQGFSGYGVDWLHVSPRLNGWFVDAGVQALALKRLASRELSGEVAFDANRQRYAFDAHSAQAGNTLRFPFQKPFDGHGLGLLFQARAGWRTQNGHAMAGVRDVGWLSWKGLPQQVLRLNSNTGTRDAYGYLVYEPLIKGNNSQADVRRRAPWTGELDLAWHVSGRQSLVLPLEYVPRLGWLPALRWEAHSAALPWSVTWRQHQRDVLTRFQWRQWDASLALGRGAYSQQWSLGYAHVF